MMGSVVNTNYGFSMFMLGSIVSQPDNGREEIAGLFSHQIYLGLLLHQDVGVSIKEA